MVRDGYTCVVTGLQDESHPAPNTGPNIYPVDLAACHILCGAIGNLSDDHKSDSVGHLLVLEMHFTHKRLFPLHSVYNCCHIV